jgi:hypothetical protein
MRTSAAIASFAAVLASTLCTLNASADTMDPAIERLTQPFVYKDQAGNTVTRSCTQNGGQFPGNVTPQVVVQCRPDNVSFAKLINQYGAAIAPTAMHSGRTTGFGGFHLSLEGAFTWIDKDAAYWSKGTQGTQDPGSKNFSDKNTGPSAALPVYSLKIRKGFPFGFEIGAQVGYMGSTNIITGGADVRISLLEGFRKGVMGILPDLAVGGGVRTISGTSQFNLTVASFDLQISKQLPIADSNIITPYLGFQQLWILGDSGLVDTTPNTDPLGYCNFTGPNVPGNPDPAKKTPGGAQVYDGQPVCNGGKGRQSATNPTGLPGSPLDFNNTFVFDKVRVVRQRFILGLQYRYELVSIGFQFMTDISSPESTKDLFGAIKDLDNATKLKGEQKQTTIVFELGAMF